MITIGDRLNASVLVRNSGTDSLVVEAITISTNQPPLWIADNITYYHNSQIATLPVGMFTLYVGDSAHVNLHTDAASTQVPLTTIQFSGRDGLGRHASDSINSSNYNWGIFPYDTTLQIYNATCIDGVAAQLSAVPSGPELLPVNPNPFSQITNIHFTLSSSSHITLRITNILGEIVKTICSDVRNAGTYVVPWDASGLPAGMYYCELFVAGRMMMQQIIKL